MLKGYMYSIDQVLLTYLSKSANIIPNEEW